MMTLRWGLCRGLLSGLLPTTSGVLEVPARGWPPVEALALFAALWASVLKRSKSRVNQIRCNTRTTN